MALGLALAVLLYATRVHSQAAEPSPIVARLDYRLDPSAKRCLTEHSVKVILNRFFEYDAIQPTAGPILGVAVSGSAQEGWYEVVLSVVNARGKMRWNSITRVQTKDCPALLVNELMLLRFLAADYLRAPGPSQAEEPFELQKDPPPEEAPPPPAAPAPAPTVMLLPPPPVLPPAEGIRFGLGLTASLGLTPTPSLGGVGSIAARWGDWSGALEARVDHSLVAAQLQSTRIEALFAGATLALPCAHRSAFSGCLVTDIGGFSFSEANERAFDGSRILFTMGLRVNFERPVTEHLVARGFAQISAIPLGAALTIEGKEMWRSPPAFGTVGLTLLVTP